MAIYIAEFRDQQGNLKKQKMKAESAAEIRSSLRSQGMTVQDVTQSKEFDWEQLGKIDIGEMPASVT
ncbi:MAG: type II secretion system F family protein, partial [Prochlorotrichaceae cyanobacterium]